MVSILRLTVQSSNRAHVFSASLFSFVLLSTYYCLWYTCDIFMMMVTVNTSILERNCRIVDRQYPISIHREFDFVIAVISIAPKPLK